MTPKKNPHMCQFEKTMRYPSIEPDKKNSFMELNTTISKGSGFYSNCAHQDLAHVCDIGMFTRSS